MDVRSVREIDDARVNVEHEPGRADGLQDRRNQLRTRVLIGLPNSLDLLTVGHQLDFSGPYAGFDLGEDLVAKLLEVGAAGSEDSDLRGGRLQPQLFLGLKDQRLRSLPGNRMSLGEIVKDPLQELNRLVVGEILQFFAEEWSPQKCADALSQFGNGVTR
jgi:hypothetical protein